MGAGAKWIGHYVGRNRVREGKEKDLSPVELKRYLKDAEILHIDLQGDGTFLHKKVLAGAYRVCGDQIDFEPKVFNGQTQDEMRQSAEAVGHAFRLGFLFQPFHLLIRDDHLESDDPAALIYVEYIRH